MAKTLASAARIGRECLTQEVRRWPVWVAITALVAARLLAGREARVHLRGRVALAPAGSIQLVAPEGRPVEFAFAGCHFEAALLRRHGGSVLRLEASHAGQEGQQLRDIPEGLDVVRFRWSPPVRRQPGQEDRSCSLTCAGFFLPDGSALFTCKAGQGTGSESMLT